MVFDGVGEGEVGAGVGGVGAGKGGRRVRRGRGCGGVPRAGLMVTWSSLPRIWRLAGTGECFAEEAAGFVVALSMTPPEVLGSYKYQPNLERRHA